MFLTKKIVKILEILEWHLKRKIKNAKSLTYTDFIFIKILDSIRNSLFMSSMTNLILFSSHEILHHDIQIEQSSSSRLSYYFSCICFNICIFDLTKIYFQLVDFKPLRVIKYERVFLRVQSDKKMMELEKKDLKKEIKMLEKRAKKNGGDRKTQKREKKLKRKFEKIVRKVEAMKKAGNYLIKNWIYAIGTTPTTLLIGIKLEYLDIDTWARFYRYAKLIKSALFEIFISSLQMLPGTQISLIFVTQLLSFFHTIYYVFYKNVLRSFWLSLVEILSELSMLVFLTMGMIMHFNSREGINFDLWVRLQFACVFLVIFSSFANIIVAFFLTLGGGLWNFAKIISYRGFFGSKWDSYRVEEIERILQKKGIETNKKLTVEKLTPKGNTVRQTEAKTGSGHEEVNRKTVSDLTKVRDDNLEDVLKREGILPNRTRPLDLKKGLPASTFRKTNQPSKNMTKLGKDKKMEVIPNKRVERKRNGNIFRNGKIN